MAAKKQIKRIILDFIWNSRAAKISYKDLCQETKKGGIGLINIETMLDSLQMRWFTRIADKKKTKIWLPILEDYLNKAQITETKDNYRISWGINQNTKVAAKYLPGYWKDHFKAWTDNSGRVEVKDWTLQKIRATPLWGGDCGMKMDARSRKAFFKITGAAHWGDIIGINGRLMLRSPPPRNAKPLEKSYFKKGWDQVEDQANWPVCWAQHWRT